MARSKKAEVFRRKDGRWMFHIISGNGEITNPSQGYTRKWNAQRALRSQFPAVTTVLVEK